MPSNRFKRTGAQPKWPAICKSKHPPQPPPPPPPPYDITSLFELFAAPDGFPDQFTKAFQWAHTNDPNVFTFSNPGLQSGFISGAAAMGTPPAALLIIVTARFATIDGPRDYEYTAVLPGWTHIGDYDQTVTVWTGPGFIRGRCQATIQS